MTGSPFIAASQCPNCHADLTELQSLKQPPAFCLQCRFPIALIAGKYQLTNVLGEGGFGTVYLAKHVRLKRNGERVVKVIRPEIFARHGMETRFHREVQITSDLSQRNEHIVRIYDDFGEAPMLGHFYVMEYLQGNPLSLYMLNTQQVPSVEWTLMLFRQLCDAMQAAHEEGIIHRDLKPDNILLIERRKNPYFVKILDFGIAKPMSHSGHTDPKLTQGALGTPMYMAPEQALNQPVDGRTDIYAMGIILYELLTGLHPFIPAGRETDITSVELLTSQLMQPPPPLRTLRPDLHISPSLECVVLKALAKQPSERYQSAEAFWSALSQTSSQENSAATQVEVQAAPTSLDTFESSDEHSFEITEEHERYATSPTGHNFFAPDESHQRTKEGTLHTTPPQVTLHESSPNHNPSQHVWLWSLPLLALLALGGTLAYSSWNPFQHTTNHLKKNTAQSQKQPQPRQPNRSNLSSIVLQVKDKNNEDKNNEDKNNEDKNNEDTLREARSQPRGNPSLSRRRRALLLTRKVQRRLRTTRPRQRCRTGETRLFIRACPQGSGKFEMTIGNREQKYGRRQLICIPRSTSSLGINMDRCRGCIVKLFGQKRMRLYLRDDTDKNRRLALNYCHHSR